MYSEFQMTNEIQQHNSLSIIAMFSLGIFNKPNKTQKSVYASFAISVIEWNVWIYNN